MFVIIKDTRAGDHFSRFGGEGTSFIHRICSGDGERAIVMVSFNKQLDITWNNMGRQFH